MTIQNFDRQNLKQLRADMDAALAAVQAKHGITITMGSMRFSADRVTCKVEANTMIDTATSMSTAGAGMADVTGLAKPLVAAMLLHGVKNVTGRKGEKLTGYNANRPKYPFSYVTVRGTRYKQSITEARRMFGATV